MKIKIPSQKKIIDSWTNKSVGVDIICHCYNQEKTISLAIDSFLMQVTNFRINIFIHDDYSNDHTREILQKYKKKYPKLITLILQGKSVVIRKKIDRHYFSIC